MALAEAVAISLHSSGCWGGPVAATTSAMASRCHSVLDSMKDLTLANWVRKVTTRLMLTQWTDPDVRMILRHNVAVGQESKCGKEKGVR